MPGLRHALPLVILGALAGPARAQVPPRCPEPEAQQFDFWIGGWDVENRQRSPQAAPGDTSLLATGSATDRVSKVLGGCAIVEHWFGELTHTTQRGFSVRAWDPTSERWVLWLNWPGPRGPGFARLEGTFADGIGTFTREVQGARGSATVRFTFSDVTDGGFRWTGAFAPQGGSWTRFWVMDFKRRYEGARPLGPYNGMSAVTEACAAETARAFDFLVGEWEARDGAALSARRILDGCAISQEERWVEQGESTARYRVQAPEAASEGWTMISIDDRERTFSRWDAAGSAALPVFRHEAEGEIRRLRYEEVGDDRFRRLEERSPDDGDTWSVIDDRVFVRVAPRLEDGP